MRKSHLTTLSILLLFGLSFLLHASVSLPLTHGYAENVKIGFSWINGINGASEMVGTGYAKAVEMGASIEHREYRWDYLDLTMTSLNEWSNLYLTKNPSLEASLALSVINGNTTALPFNITSFSRYTAISPNITRLNDTLILNTLRNMTIKVFDVVNVTYISFGSEINGFFETYFDYETKTLTSTAMLEDYVDLLEKMYQFIHSRYPSVKVLTIFRYQLPMDIENIKVLLPYFTSTCDIFGISARIFTDDYGRLAYLSETDVYERFSAFTNLTSKKVAITNTYTISDSRSGGSERYQANYIHYLFSTIKKLENKLEFVCWYTLYDYPPGYLSTYFSPFLEVHATAGLLSSKGNIKPSYHAWIEEMRAAGKLPSYFLAWKIALASLFLAAIVGFLVFVYVKEIPEFKKDWVLKPKALKEEKTDAPKTIQLEEKKTKKTKAATTQEAGEEKEEVAEENTE